MTCIKTGIKIESGDDKPEPAAKEPAVEEPDAEEPIQQNVVNNSVVSPSPSLSPLSSPSSDSSGEKKEENLTASGNKRRIIGENLAHL